MEHNFKFGVSYAEQRPLTAPLPLCGDVCDAFRYAKDIGLDGIEIHGREYEFTDEQVERIRELMQNFYDAITGGQDQPESVSLLVKRALSMIETYYSQGITLEELAERLCVTDEYLSTLIKKETGISFTETVRKMRIERIKELLLHSSLKLNQIAEMVGYSDPKYMSKVFKEEVGMLPAQFRKQNH